MTWFRVDDTFYRSKKVRKLGRDKVACVGLWTLCGDWSADNLTDGFVPWEIVEDWDPGRELAEKLIAVGLWYEAENDDELGIEFHDWADWNPTKERVLQRRKADAERRARWREARRNAVTSDEPNEESRRESRRDTPRDSRGESRQGSALPDPTRPDPDKRETPSLSSSEIPPREDVERLCLHLANRVAENTGRRPNITKRWHDAARLLLDKDLEGEPDPLGLAIRLVDWATSDEFWRSNILSLPKFREKFDQLRLRARQQWEQTHRARPPRRTTDDKVAAVGPLVEKVLGLNGSPTPRPELQAITGGRNW